MAANESASDGENNAVESESEMADSQHNSDVLDGEGELEGGARTVQR